MNNPNPSTQPTAWHVRGGVVIDPAHHDRPTPRDVFIADGLIVPSLPAEVTPQVIDATGCVIMAGGVDMHTHIASTGVNIARQLQGDARVDGQRLVPSTFDTGRRYAALGYTTAIEAAVAPSDALHAHFQLDDTPCIDSGLLTLVDNHALVIELAEQSDQAALTALVNELLARSGALGMKVVNPGGVTAWREDPSHWQIQGIHQPLPGRPSLTPARLLAMLAQASDDLALPHPMHFHGNRLGQPGNVQTLIDSLDAIAGRRAHIAHLQFYGYGQTQSGNFTSAAKQLTSHLARHPSFTADVGMVMFGPAMTITADTPLEQDLWRRTGSVGRPAVFSENDLEAAIGVMPATYERRNRIHSLQWAIGLELLLRCENPWQISLSIDHPNGGSFAHFPAILALLMHRDLRRAALSAAHPYATRHSGLADIDREMTLQEIAILTRAAPARALGLAHKGHLAAGADADVVLYDTTMSDTQAMFARPRLVLKAGQVVAQAGRCVRDVPGQRLRAALTTPTGHDGPLARWRRDHAGMASDAWALPASRLSRMTAIPRAHRPLA